MEQNKVKGYGKRGWLLIIWIATAFLAYTAIGNYPLNVLSDLYGGQQTLSTIYTVASIIGVLVQLVVSSFIGKLKSIKKLGVLMGILSIASLIGIMFIPGYIPGTMQTVWQVVYGFGTVLSLMYGTFALSILVGQWFPTRKGSVMGISTCAFPIGNGLIGPFVATVFSGQNPQVAKAFTPFLIVFIVGLIIGAIFIPDYPEECGAYRDNNPNMTPEMAKAMMMQEIEDKKTTVWKLNHTLTTRDFWFITIPAGLLLMFSVGVMTQSTIIFGSAGFNQQQTGMMQMGIMICGLIGSVLLGFLDEKLGTKKAMIIGCVFMLIAGICGGISGGKPALVVVAMLFLAVFMGASSNFTVSLAAQYWRREDFGTVFAAVNPIANMINNIGPMLIGMIMGMTGSYIMIFVVCAVMGVLSIILLFLFNPAHVKEKDDKFRKEAGKPLDDALVGRK